MGDYRKSPEDYVERIEITDIVLPSVQDDIKNVTHLENHMHQSWVRFGPFMSRSLEREECHWK